MKNNQSGRSMVEMLGVLAIIGVLSAGGLAGYSKAMFKHKLNSTMDQITMLVTNIRTMYGTQGNYDGLDNGAAVDLGIVPAIMGSTSTLTNPFKGNVTITRLLADDGATTAPSTGSATAFAVTYDSLPKEACIALATSDFGSGAGSGFIGVTIGGIATNVIGSNEGKAKTMEDVLKTQAEGGCYEQATVSWKFY